MTRRITRDDPEYEATMREAKALFEAAMAKGVMKGRGRPAAAKVAVAEVAEDDEEGAEILDEILEAAEAAD